MKVKRNKPQTITYKQALTWLTNKTKELGLNNIDELEEYNQFESYDPDVSLHIMALVSEEIELSKQTVKDLNDKTEMKEKVKNYLKEHENDIYDSK